MVADSKNRGPGASYPDQRPDATKASVTIAEMEPFFGRPASLPPDVTDETPITTETLIGFFGNGAPNANMTEILHTSFTNADGWWFRFAPLVRSHGVTSSWAVTKVKASAMDLAPEGAAPRFIEHTHERFFEKMRRFNNGFRISGDFIKTREGREEMSLNIAAVVSEQHVTAKLLCAAAVLTASKRAPSLPPAPRTHDAPGASRAQKTTGWRRRAKSARPTSPPAMRVRKRPAALAASPNRPSPSTICSTTRAASCRPRASR